MTVYSLRPLRFMLPGVAALLVACGDSEPENEPLSGSWSVVMDPPMPVDWPGICPRSVPYATMALGEDGGFELSVNVYDDCRSSGGEFSASEVLRFGSYTRLGATLTITLDGVNSPALTGLIEGTFIRLTLPPEVGVSSADLELLLGPRQPF